MACAGWPDWTKAIPAHWRLRRFKYVCTRYSDYGLNEPATSYASEGVRFIRTSDIDDDGNLNAEGVYLPEEATRKHELADGDLLVSRSGTIGRSFLYCKERHGRCSFAGYLIRYRLNDALDPRFVFFFTKSKPFFDWVNDSVISATIGNVNGQKFANTPIGVPPIEEQKSIVRFLERETSRIEEFINRKRNMLKLLEEKRLAVITQAVSSGIDKSVAVKDSGISWLGKIPLHWAIKRLKFVSPKVTVGIVVNPSAYYVDNGVVALRGINIRERALDLSELVYIDEKSNEFHSKSKIFTGDLISVRTGEPGTTAVVTNVLHGSNCVDLIITRKPPNVDSRYLAFFANSDIAKLQYGSGAEGALQQHFNIETAKNLIVPLPPKEEQCRIVDYLTEKELAIREMMTKVQSAVDVLVEYRSALITDAVTGKIDVRGLKEKEAAA